jgi:sigma-E factor negative regulatory protein RseC
LQAKKMTVSKVTHNGTVISVDGVKASVKIEVQSACSGCHAKGLCSAADMAEKIIETVSEESLTVGDSVVVEMDERLGFKAVLFAFLIPFFLIVATLFAAWNITGSETVAAFSSIGILVPYYLGLVVFKTYFKKNFVFTCRKISNISQ